jgi:hypothetical protein
LDFVDVVSLTGAQLIYRATVNYKQVGGQHHPVCESTGTLILSDCVDVEISGISLQRGIYRLNAFVKVALDEISPGMMASLTGDLLNVY